MHLWNIEIYLQLNCNKMRILISILSLTGVLNAGLLSAQERKARVVVEQKRDTSANTKAIKLREVGIKGMKKRLPGTTISSSLSSDQLEQLSGGSLADALKNIAGLNVLKTGATISKPVIHGLHSNRILILNNGVRLEGQQWGAEHAPEIDPAIASDMVVIKGAAAVRYGAEAIGGVIFVRPAALPVSAGFAGTVNGTAASNGRAGTGSIMVNGGLKELPGFGWRLQGTLKKAGNVRTADYYLGNTGLREQNYAATMGYTNAHSNYELYYSRFSTELGILYSAHVGTKEDIEARIALGRPLEDYGFTYAITAPRQQIAHDLLKLKVHYDLKNGKTAELTYGFQQNHRKEFDIRRGDRSALPITDLVLKTHTLDLSFDQPLQQGVKRTFGFNGMAQVNNNIPGTLANTFIPNYDSFSGGAFVIQRWIKEFVELEAGLRYDYKVFDAKGFRYQSGGSSIATDQGVSSEYYGQRSHFHNVTGTFGAVWKIIPHWQLSSNIGLGWRAPTANELFSHGLHHGAGLYEIGDPKLKTEQGYKWVSSIRHISDRFNFNLDVYGQYLHGYIYSRPDGSFQQTISGTYPIFRYAQTNALFVGADLSANYRFSSLWSYQLNAALISAKDQSNDKYLPYIPANRIDHHLRLDFALVKETPFYLQFGHTYVARQTRYDPGTDYAAPPSAYHLFQAQLGTTLKFDSQQLGMSLSADNLFNTAYKDYMNRYRYYTHDMGRNISLRLAYKF